MVGLGPIPGMGDLALVGLILGAIYMVLRKLPLTGTRRARGIRSAILAAVRCTERQLDVARPKPLTTGFPDPGRNASPLSSREAQHPRRRGAARHQGRRRAVAYGGRPGTTLSPGGRGR